MDHMLSSSLHLCSLLMTVTTPGVLFAICVPVWLLSGVSVRVHDTWGRCWTGCFDFVAKTIGFGVWRSELKPHLWYFSAGTTWTGHLTFLSFFFYMYRGNWQLPHKVLLRLYTRGGPELLNKNEQYIYIHISSYMGIYYLNEALCYKQPQKSQWPLAIYTIFA